MKQRAIVLCAALLAAGCNEILGLDAEFTTPDADGGGGDGAGAEVGAGGEGGDPSAGAGPSNGGGAEGGSGGGEPAVEATCEEYCETITTNCVNANNEYAANVCPIMCGYMVKGHVGDTSGDTVGCRLTKAKLAEEDPVTYCQQAGPLGVDGCAEPCDAFCAQVFATCTVAEAVPFDDFVDCQTQCGELEYLRLEEGGSDIATTTGNNLNCWLYHLQVANFGSPHCSHFGEQAGQCVDP